MQLSVRHAAKDCLVAHPNNANKPEMRERERERERGGLESEKPKMQALNPKP